MAVPGSNFSDEQIDQQLLSRQGQIRPESLLQSTPVETDQEDSTILQFDNLHLDHQPDDDNQSLPPLITNNNHHSSISNNINNNNNNNNNSLPDFELFLDDIVNNAQSMDTVIQLKTSLSTLNHNVHDDHYDSDNVDTNDHSGELIHKLIQQNHDLKTDLKYMIDKYNQTLCLSKKAFTQLQAIMNGIRSQKSFQIDDLWTLIMSNNDCAVNKFDQELIVHSVNESCPVKGSIVIKDTDSFVNFENSSTSPHSDDVDLHLKLLNNGPLKKSLIRSSSAVQPKHPNNITGSPKIVTTNFEEFKLGKAPNKTLVYHSSVTNLNRTSRTGGGSAASLMSPSGVNECSHGNVAGFGSYEISQQLIDKQIGAIERSYGGAIARQAAYTIQRAYRSYRLRKRFTSLAMQAISQKKMLTSRQKSMTEGQSLEQQQQSQHSEQPIEPLNTVVRRHHHHHHHHHHNETVSINSGDDTDNQTTTDIDNSQQSKGSASSIGLSNSAMNAVSNSSSSSIAAAANAQPTIGAAISAGEVATRMDTLHVHQQAGDDQRTMSLSPIDRAAMQNRFSRKLSANFALEDMRLQGSAGIQQQQHHQHHQQQLQQQQQHQQQQQQQLSQQRSLSIHPQHMLGTATMLASTNLPTVAGGHLSSNRDFYTIPRQGSPPIVVPVAYESVYNTVSSSSMYHHNNNVAAANNNGIANNGSARNLIGHELVTPKKTPSFSSTSSTGSGSTGSLHAGWSNHSSKHQTHSHTLPNHEHSRSVRSSSRQFGQVSQDKKFHNSSTASVTNLSNSIANTSTNNSTMTVNRPIPLTMAGSNQVTFAPNVSEVSSNHSEPSNSTEDACRKRRYRVGLNLFNKSPSERGIQFLIDNGFIDRFDSVDQQAKCVAQFLHTRKGMSRQMIGEYISENKDFNKLVLKHFCLVIDFSGTIVDEALRYFQSFFRFPGEAQKIERLVDAFADRYKECNPGDVLSRDSVFILAFAIIMLNTDLHKPTNIRHRMTPEQWLNNLKGVFLEGDLSNKFLMDIYKRIKRQELVTGTDHVSQVIKVQSTIVGRDVPNFALPHRRLVCYCSLYEIRDLNRYQKAGQHPRDIFLFNDLLLITKVSNRTRHGTMAEYQYRSSTPLDGLQVLVFSTAYYPNGVRITRRVDNKLIACFNARNDLDQQRFVDDLQEAINEMDEMEQLRIQKSNSMVQLGNSNNNHHRVNALDSVTHFGQVSQLNNDNGRRQIYHTAV